MQSLNALSRHGTSSRLVLVAAWAASMWLFAPSLAFAASTPSPVDRGKTVALAADCFSCHTQPGGKPYAGGAALATQFGKIYPPNITPDAKTGIGGWTEADFARAIREGVRKDGALLYPAMPYGSYTKMSDEDVKALWTYMQSITPVRHSLPANTMRFPTNIRSGLAVWRIAYFKPGRFTPAAEKSEQWNRGAYLVEALGHCGDCHTPRNIAQATEEQHHLTGAQIEGWYAPDISNTPLSKLDKLTVDELASFLKTGRTRGNTNAFGPMREVIHNSLSQISDSDVLAMASYLKDQPGQATEPKLKPIKLADERLVAGKAVYEQQCSTCHKDDGMGIKNSVPALAGNTAVAARQPFNVVMAVLQGFEPQGSWGSMPSFRTLLDDQQVADVANYVRTAWGNRGEQIATAWTVGNLRGTAQAGTATDTAGLVCPTLSQDVLAPAMRQGAEAWRQSADDPAKLQQLVRAYQAARPRASPAQVIEAVSTAYCRAVVAGSAPNAPSAASTGAKMAAFSQQVASVLVDSPQSGSTKNRHVTR